MPRQSKLALDQVFDNDASRLDEGDLGGGKTTAVVTSTDWTTDTILNQLRRENINLSPKFQRREAWTDDRKSRFIESLFLGYPVPQLVLAETKSPKGKYIVIDGKQRLLAIRRFAASGNNDPFVPLELTDLEFRKDLNGKTLEELKETAKFRDDVNWYENQPIRTVVIRNWEAEDVLYRIFIRLNTGSLPLSTQELRQALHPGPFSDFADDFAATNQALHEALSIEGPDFRMRDVEILVRYFAFVFFLPQYTGNLKRFLDSTCANLNKRWLGEEGLIREEADRCQHAVETTIEIFGENAFRRWNDEQFDGPFNRAIFDVMTYFFRRDDLARRARGRVNQVQNAFTNLCSTDTRFLNSIQTTTKSLSATSNRLSKWARALSIALDMPIPVPELRGTRITVP